LCAAAVFTSEAKPLGTMADALLNVFEENPVAATVSFETKANHFTVSATVDQLAEKLIAKGIHATLAKQISTEVSAKDGMFFHLTRLLSKEISTGVDQSAICVFKKSIRSEQRDLLCFSAETKFEGNFAEVVESIKASILGAFKKLISRLPSSIINYHAYTKLNLSEFFRLKSAQTQADLDKMLRDAVGSKDQVVYELNQKKNDPFIAKLFKNGITSYTSSAVVESLEGVEVDFLSEYTDFLADKMSIPANARPTFKDQLFLSSITDKNEWKEFEFLFKLNSGTAKYVSVMSVLDSRTNTLDFLNSDIKAGFELGPDVIISTKRRSYFFGLFSSTTIEITKRPAELTMQSIELLFKFFKVAAFEKFRAFRHI
jgi:hypothetical protein